MALINFMGGIGAAAEGYNKGAREQRADDKQVDVDAYDAKVRDAETTLLPSKTQAALAANEELISNAADRKEISPDKQRLAKIEASSAADLAPGKAEAAKNQQLLEAKTFGYKTSEAVRLGRKNASDAEEEMRAGIGRHLEDGNLPAANALIANAYDSPVIFPSLYGKSPPVSTDIGQAPAGALDIGGQPVTGSAIVMKMADGSTQYMPASFFDAALKRKKEKEQADNAGVMGVGGTGYDKRTGQVTVEATNGMTQQGFESDGVTPHYVKSAGRGGPGKEVDPLSKTDKATLDSINRQRDKTQAAILKGITDGADPKQMAAYAKIMAGLDIDERAMYAKYEGEKPGVADDKLGFRPSLKPGGVTPKAGATPGASSGNGTGRVGDFSRDAAGQNDILQSQISKVTSEIKKDKERLNTPGFDRPENAAEVTLVRESLARNNSDLVSLNKEVSRLRLPASMTTRPGGVTPTASVAPTTAAAPAPPITPTAAAPVNNPGGGRSVSGSLGNTSATTPVAAATQTPVVNPPASQYTAGRPSVGGVLSNTLVPEPVPPQPAVRVTAPIGKSPQTMGDDFESPLARAALIQRVRDAGSGGAPLSRVEMLRARQLRLIA